MRRQFVFFSGCFLVSAGVAFPACSTEGITLGRGGGEAHPPILQAQNEAGADGAVLLACVGTECPQGFGTCSAAERCAVNLMTDPLNCGACGVVCPAAQDIGLRSSCVEGTCVYHCSSVGGGIYANCNGLLDDGCEISIDTDPNNCGGCGIQCGPDEPCDHGNCKRCKFPKVRCGDECVDLNTSPANCGACGHACDPVADGCSPLPPNMDYGCLGGTCGRLTCGAMWGDCDNTAGCGSNGCETPLDTNDDCGSCGNKCNPDQQCRQVGDYFYACVDRCEKSGRTDCLGGGSNGGFDPCRDLTTDVDHCGGCNMACAAAGPNQIDKCDRGVCTVECKINFADCNGDPSDGCEVDLTTNAANCGTCGNSCDLAAGQPCIAGKCLMVECDGGVETR